MCFTAIGLGFAAAGSVASSVSSNNASKRAAQASQQATDQSIALQRESRDMALQRLDPFGNRGNVAGNAINDLLGLGGNQTDWAAYVNADPAAVQDWQTNWAGGQGSLGNKTIEEYGQFHYNLDGRRRDLTPFTTTGQQRAQNAFDTFRNSTGYQFRVNEGEDALNSGFAGSGLVQSGAALRALDDYRQNMATGEFGNYMAYLGQQQGVGAGAASASAGVGQNFASNAGNLIMNNAGNQANAAIARAQNNPFASGLGVIGGGLLGYGGLGR